MNPKPLRMVSKQSHRRTMKYPTEGADIRKTRRAFKGRRAITKFCKYYLLYILLMLAFGSLAWYCWSIGWPILGVCLIVGLASYLALVALDIV